MMTGDDVERLLCHAINEGASQRQLWLFTCAAWRWRYTRSGPGILRHTLFRLLLGPLEKMERFADGEGELIPPAWWGSYTFAMPDARQAARETIGIFQQKWLKAYDWRTEGPVLCQLLLDIVGTGSYQAASGKLAWRTPLVKDLAQAVYDQRKIPTGELDPIRLAILADAVEEAGCTDADILTHLRGPGPHVRGCHILDLVLGKT